MTSEMIMSRLRRAGTAQNRKVYGRHGVTGDLFGVSYAELNKLAREIKIDSGLARDLWDTGYHEARILATMIIDPADCNAALLEAWVAGIDNYPLADAFSKLVAQTGQALRKAEKWIGAPADFTGAAGWNLVGVLATDERCSDAWFSKHLETIRAEIHERPNRTRHSMNTAMICIGIARPGLRPLVFEIAQEVGTVEVDHGETNCVTPDAAGYIRKTLMHRAERQQAAAARAAAPRAAAKKPRKTGGRRGPAQRRSTRR